MRSVLGNMIKPVIVGFVKEHDRVIGKIKKEVKEIVGNSSVKMKKKGKYIR